MERLKVIRSKTAIENVKKEIANSQKVQTFSTMRKVSARAMTISETDDQVENNSIEGTIDENYLENYTSATASDSPDKSTLTLGADIREGSSYECGVDVDLDTYELVSTQSVQESELEFNNPIYSNFVDETRGNVIKTEMQDSFYIRSPRVGSKEIERSIIGLDVAKNAIENPFIGQDLSNGATMTFWAKMPDVSTLYNKRGLISFIKDLNLYNHPTHPNAPQVLFQPYLYINCMGDMMYDNAWYNGMWKGVDVTKVLETRRIARTGKNWEHFIISFTDDDIVIYINGILYDVYTEDNLSKAKNFNKPNTETITDMISNSNTQIFLAITLKNEETFSDAILYDDITFYAQSVTDAEAKELYEEALTINLP